MSSTDETSPEQFLPHFFFFFYITNYMRKMLLREEKFAFNDFFAVDVDAKLEKIFAYARKKNVNYLKQKNPRHGNNLIMKGDNVNVSACVRV